MQCPSLGWLANAVTHAWHWFGDVKAGEWLLFLSEIFVGVVIYLELEHNRFTSFLERATEKDADAERRAIYALYLSLPGTPEEKAAAFHEMIYRQTDEGTTLKLKCDNLIALFNDMGFASNHWLSGHWLPFKTNRFISLFPHAPVYVWKVVGPYIRDRRAATGPWFARNCLIFIERSVEYVLKYGDDLKLTQPNGQDGITITVEEMKKMKRELGALVGAKASSKGR
ncbi:MAG: hypothetical protein WAN65_05320 [Candidatus Sulfotelmatobacter sp.]